MVNDEWMKAQQHEKEYYYFGKNKQWRTPHSLEYWLNFLQIDKLDGIGLEVGCGPNGLYNFADSVIGIDSINYHKRNFVKCIGESLPFQSKTIDFVICCNSLDHCQNPQLVINEMLRVTNKLIIWLNIFPRFIGQVLNKIDKTHLYHFDMNELKKLFPTNISYKKQHQKSILAWHGSNAVWIGILKLFFASILGVKGICLHLEVKY